MSFESSNSDEENGLRSSQEEDKASCTGKDEAMFSLLFSHCEKDDTGWAIIEDLVAYIKKMLDTRNSPVKEDVYNSDESAHKANYNLELLKHMLNTYAVDGTINFVTYKYVIGKWVKDVRSRSPSPNDSCISGSSNYKEEPDASIVSRSSVTSLLQESYETSGAEVHYSNHEVDPHELKNTISELQLEAKRLKDRNDQLLIQMESSEENMKQLQVENSELNLRIKSQQQCLGQMESVKEDNTELALRLVEGEKICVELKERIDNLQQELQELQSEISHLQNQLTLANKERDDFYCETQTLQNTLGLREDQIRQLEEEKVEIESRLENEHLEAQTLHHHLKSTNEEVEELKQENSSLQHQIQRAPVSSTPFRPSAPSLAEELANSDIPNGMSPVILMNSSIDDLMDSIDQGNKPGNNEDDVFKKLALARTKFEEKAKLIDEGLSELIDTPLTTVNGDRTSNGGGGSMTNTEEYKDVLESSLRKIETRKKREMKRTQKMSEDLKRAKEENKNLKNKLDELKRQMNLNEENKDPNVPVPAVKRVVSSTQTTLNGFEEPKRIENESIATQTPANVVEAEQCVMDVNQEPVFSVSVPSEPVQTTPTSVSSVAKPKDDHSSTRNDNEDAHVTMDTSTSQRNNNLINVPSNREGTVLTTPSSSGTSPISVSQRNNDVGQATPSSSGTSPITIPPRNNDFGEATPSSSGTSPISVSQRNSDVVQATSSSGTSSPSVGTPSRTAEVDPLTDSAYSTMRVVRDPLTDTLSSIGSSALNSANTSPDLSTTNKTVNNLPKVNESAPALVQERLNESSSIPQHELPTGTYDIPVEGDPKDNDVILGGHLSSLTGTSVTDSSVIYNNMSSQSNTEGTISCESPLTDTATGKTTPSNTRRELLLPDHNSNTSIHISSDGSSSFTRQTSHGKDMSPTITSTMGVVSSVVPLKSDSNVLKSDNETVAGSAPLTKVLVLQEDVAPTDTHYEALEEEITHLKEQLHFAQQQNTLEECDSPHLDQHRLDLSLQQTPDRRAGDSLKIRRRKPQLQITSVFEDSIVATPTNLSESGCLSTLGRFIWNTIKACVLLSLFLALLFLLLLIIIGLSSTLARCGGRVCNQSPLHMFFGQNLEYTHTGEVPI